MSAVAAPSPSSSSSSPEAIERLARFGLLGKAMLYAVTGFLALRLAQGTGEQDAGSTGAIDWIADQSWGGPALVLLAASLASLAVWRVVTLVTGDPVEGDDWDARAKFGAKALFYGALAVVAFTSATGGSSSSNSGGSGSSTSEQAASTVFDLPLGRWLVFAGGLLVLGLAGMVLKRHAVDAEFLERVRSGAGSFADRAGRVGYGLRSLAYATVGIFIVQAAVTHDPDKAKSLGQSLRALGDSTIGAVALLLIAIGFLASAAFTAYESKDRIDA